MTDPSDKEEDEARKKLGEINYRKAFDNFLQQVLTRPQFYMLIGLRFGISLVTNTVPGYFKAFGLALGCEHIP